MSHDTAVESMVPLKIRAMFKTTVLITGASMLLVYAISTQSLWIDEGVTVWLASHSDLRSLATTISGMNTSDPQMPLHVLYMWVWGRVVGWNEYALRAANVPLAILLVSVLAFTSTLTFRRPALWIVCCFSPFLWFYMNEARPYVGIMAFAGLSTGAAVMYQSRSVKQVRLLPWLCLSGLWLGWGFHMLTIFVAPALAVLLWPRRDETRRVLREWKWAALAHLPLFVLLGAYFARTVWAGVGGERDTPGLGNIAFALYEFGGFAGLGPPRNVLRMGTDAPAWASYVPWLASGVAAWAALCAAAVWRLSRRQEEADDRAMLWRVLGAFVVAFLLFVAAAVAADFRFLGRHLAPLFPLFLFALLKLAGPATSKRSWGRLDRLAVAMLVAVWILSAFRLSFLPTYWKDDYRDAAQFALERSRNCGVTLVWVADRSTGTYYGVSEARQAGEGRADDAVVVAANWSAAKAENLLTDALRTHGVLLALSKPDEHDVHGAWLGAIRRFAPAKIASFSAFDIYIFHGESRRFVQGEVPAVCSSLL